MGYILFLFIRAVLVFVAVRIGAKIWRENKWPVKTLVVAGMLLVGLGGFSASFLMVKFRVAQTAFNYLGSKYQSSSAFSLDFASIFESAHADSTKSESHQVGYVVGTNTGRLTIERGKGTHGHYYVVIADEPGK